MQTLEQRRAKRRGGIFAECRNAGLDADARRYLVAELTGCTSLKDCTLAQLEVVHEHLKARNRKANPAAQPRPTNPWGFVFNTPPERQHMLKKIYRLAQRVGALMQPPVAVAPPHYVEGIVAQMRGFNTQAGKVSVSLSHCDAGQLHTVVQILESYLKRHGG